MFRPDDIVIRTGPYFDGVNAGDLCIIKDVYKCDLLSCDMYYECGQEINLYNATVKHCGRRFIKYTKSKFKGNTSLYTGKFIK